MELNVLQDKLLECVESLKAKKNLPSGVSVSSMLNSFRNLIYQRRDYGKEYYVRSLRYYKGYCEEFSELIEHLKDVELTSLQLSRMASLTNELYTRFSFNDLTIHRVTHRSPDQSLNGNIQIRDSGNITTLAIFSFNSFGPFTTISFGYYANPVDNLSSSDAFREMFKLKLEKCISEIVDGSNGLILFSDATGHRTFSRLTKFLGKDYFIYLANGVRNPNTGNGMDVATVKESLDKFSNSIDSNKKIVSDMLARGNESLFCGFTGLCGGEIAISKNRSGTDDRFITKKKGVFPVFYLEDVEDIEVGRYIPILEGTKNAFIYAK